MAKKPIFDKLSTLLAPAEGQLQTIKENERNNITILPELQALIPPLSPEESVQLELNILSEGCRDPLVIWPQGDENVLIDGHNRYGICTKHGLDFKFVKANFSSVSEVKDWMIKNQLGKRNITEESKSYLRGLQYRREKNKHGGNGNNQFSPKGSEDTTKTGLKTADKIAIEHKVSEKTIRNDEKFAEAVDILITNLGPDIKNRILNRDIKAGKPEVVVWSKTSPETQAHILFRIDTGQARDLKQALQQTDKQANNNIKSPKTNVGKVFFSTKVRKILDKHPEGRNIEAITSDLLTGINNLILNPENSDEQWQQLELYLNILKTKINQ